MIFCKKTLISNQRPNSEVEFYHNIKTKKKTLNIDKNGISDSWKYSRRKLLSEAARLVPSINSRDFEIKGKPGVRAQLFHVPSGRLEMDFIVRQGEKSTHVLNAVSPAWTSSLAVAEHVVAGIESGNLAP